MCSGLSGVLSSELFWFGRLAAAILTCMGVWLHNQCPALNEALLGVWNSDAAPASRESPAKTEDALSPAPGL